MPPGGAVDAEARRRGQTIYAPDGRIPLHPTVISEGAASLLAGEIRSAYVWRFELDAAATVTATTLRRARVRSRRQLTYAEAQAAIDNGSADESLHLLKEVGLGRIEIERGRGGASLNRPDEEVDFEDGHYLLVRRNPLPVEEWNAQISLMTGMAAAEIMLDGGVGILRTMPAPDDETLHNFRRQVAALGCPWPIEQAYGEYLRGLDPAQPKALAAVHAATSLFRGAGYTAFDGELPEERLQAAVAAPYAHATAPLRRLVDRFVLVTCEALVAGRPVPEWVREALPSLAEGDGALRRDCLPPRQGIGRCDRSRAAQRQGRRGVRGRRDQREGRRWHSAAHRPGGVGEHRRRGDGRRDGACHLGLRRHRQRDGRFPGLIWRVLSRAPP